MNEVFYIFFSGHHCETSMTSLSQSYLEFTYILVTLKPNHANSTTIILFSFQCETIFLTILTSTMESKPANKINFTQDINVKFLDHYLTMTSQLYRYIYIYISTLVNIKTFLEMKHKNISSKIFFKIPSLCKYRNLPVQSQYFKIFMNF